MSKIKVIEEILHAKFRPKDQNQIIEENTDNKGMKFRVSYPIISGNLDYVLYRLNPDDVDVFPFFSQVSGLKKICDYILFVEESTYLYIFLIELKLSPISAKKQLLASKEFANFIINSSRRIGKVLNEPITIRMIRICDSKIKKRKTNEEKVIEYDNDMYCDYQYRNVRLKHLTHY